ncbi:hypothetical protein IQ07DRAFT_597962 [Pyrenochaeta sp. DS3sAY3a]|nr:hypothetical protein IQ07DRAFT_597962 [Pyrenochaeta sp. DS3sAY3a]
MHATQPADRRLLAANAHLSLLPAASCLRPAVDAVWQSSHDATLWCPDLSLALPVGHPGEDRAPPPYRLCPGSHVMRRGQVPSLAPHWHPRIANKSAFVSTPVYSSHHGQPGWSQA